MKTCIVCSRKIPSGSGSRCPTHDLTYNTTERARMKTAVDHWRAEYGNWCPGWNRPAHAADDLTADHVTPVSRGGAGGPLQVLCRSCNSRRQNTPP